MSEGEFYVFDTAYDTSRKTVQTTQMKRSLEELAAYLGREMNFPHGAFLMTGTGIVPPDQFTLATGDRVHIQVGTQHLSNEIR